MPTTSLHAACLPAQSVKHLDAHAAKDKAVGSLDPSRRHKHHGGAPPPPAARLQDPHFECSRASLLAAQSSGEPATPAQQQPLEVGPHYHVTGAEPAEQPAPVRGGTVPDAGTAAGKRGSHGCDSREAGRAEPADAATKQPASADQSVATTWACPTCCIAGCIQHDAEHSSGGREASAAVVSAALAMHHSATQAGKCFEPGAPPEIEQAVDVSSQK